MSSARRSRRASSGSESPRTRIEAQFSLPYSVAIAFLHGEAGYEFFTEKWIGNPEIDALARKVTLEADESRSLEEEPVLTVRIRDGRVLAGQQLIPIGDPANPVPEADIRAKYRALATRHLSPETARRLEEAVLALDRPGRLAEVRAILAARRNLSELDSVMPA